VDDVTMVSISPFVHPLEYNLELTLSNDVNVTSKLKGRVIIEFRVDDTTPLNQLSLNARNITATRYKLSFIEENGARAKRRRRRRAESNDTGGQENAGTSEICHINSLSRQYPSLKLFSAFLDCNKNNISVNM